ncbi:MAG: hypothetical protein JW902_12095 [Syntrophaceae bacterium]|nr:hypothetical protein [Syntrophaceae bacterium]
MQNQSILAETEASFSSADIAYLESARWFISVPGGYVVHAGIPPSLTHIPSDNDIDALSRGERKRLEQVLRIRFVRGKTAVYSTIEIRSDENIPLEESANTNIGSYLSVYLSRCQDARLIKKIVREKGEFIQLGKQTPEDPFWAEIYDGRFGHIYFGHEPFVNDTEPRIYPHATALDLGCVYGNRLAAIIIETGEVFSVPSTDKYDLGLWEE